MQDKLLSVIRPCQDFTQTISLGKYRSERQRRERAEDELRQLIEEFCFEMTNAERFVICKDLMGHMIAATATVLHTEIFPVCHTDEVLSGVNLSGKRILVTGVSAGVGVETARALVTHGAHVVGAARHQFAFNKTQKTA